MFTEHRRFAFFFEENEVLLSRSVARENLSPTYVTVNGGISNDFETENKPLTSTPASMSTQSRQGKRQALGEHFAEGTARIDKHGRFSDSLASFLVKASSYLDTCSLNEAQKARTNVCAICLSVLLSFFFQVYERNIRKSVMFRAYREQRDLLLDHTPRVERN